MGLDDVRDRLYNLTARFFAGANVLWAEQVNVQPQTPYVTLKLGAVRRRAHTVDDRDAGPCYHCETTAEVNLYTEGRQIAVEGKATGNYVNTATEDMLRFANYMESPAVIDTLSDPPIAVTLKGDVRDLTFLENDRKHRYRAMAEFDVGFVMEADGWYGILGVPVPSASGGGTEEMASMGIEKIEETEIEIAV